MRSKFKWITTLSLVFFMQICFAQDRTVSGIVTDNAGLPIPGVSIAAKGQKTGTQTDFDGKYAIKVSSDQTLVFTYVGMKTVEVLAKSTTQNVVMASTAMELESVVVTALGIKREKKSLGYAQQEVRGEALSESGQLNALSALSGNVAGLQITSPSTMGGSSRVVLRGIGTITGENKPLIVIDGIPLDNGNYNTSNTQRGAGGRDYGDASADINPDDIESVSILKGGPAAALYGNRAGNGAILYTTKSAKKGNGKATIEFNSSLTMESVYIMPTLQNEYGGGSSSTLQTQMINGKLYHIADYATDESWGPKYDKNLMYLPWNAFDPEFSKDYLKEKAWVKSNNDVRSFFNTGITKNNSLSYSKSVNGTNVRVSYANQSIEGVVPNSTLDKNTFSVNANSQLSDKLKLESMATYTLTKGFNRPEVGYGDNSLGQKFFQWGQRQLDYNDLKDYKLANGSQRSWNRIAWDDGTPNYSDNPYWIVNENTSSDTRNRLYGNTKLTYNFTPELYGVANVYADTYSLRINERVAIGSQAQSSYQESVRQLTDFNYEGRLHFDKKWDKFSVNSFVGANRRSYNFNSLTGVSVGGLVIPNLYNLANSKEQARATNRQEEMRTNSLYAFVSLGYNDMFFLELTDRNDWFSTVSKDVNYASATGSFIFSGLLNAKWLNFGKIRGGWAQAGNATMPYNLENYLTIAPPFNGEPSYSSPIVSNSRDLRPELKTTKEFGLDLKMFNNRLSIDASLYEVTTTDLITPIEVEASTGFRSKLANAGTMRNRGVESTIVINPVRTNDFNWDVTWNFAKNDNKVISLYEDAGSLELGRAPFRARLLAVKGEKYGQIYGTDFTYDANGNKVVGADGLYVASGQKALGSIIADYNMGIRNSFKYKNLSFSFLIDMQKGGSYFSTSHMFGTYSGMLTTSTEGGIRENGIVLPGVDASGNPNTVNVSAQTWSQSHYAGIDALNVFDASYMKLREVNLGYNLPSKWIGSYFSSVKLSAYALNLFTWGLDWKGMDPEMASYGSGNVQGLEGGSLPSTRTYGMNLQLKF